MPPAATLERTDLRVADFLLTEANLPGFYGMTPAEFTGYRQLANIPRPIIVNGERRFLASDCLEHLKSSARIGFDIDGMPAGWPYAVAGDEFKQVCEQADRYLERDEAMTLAGQLAGFSVRADHPCANTRAPDPSTTYCGKPLWREKNLKRWAKRFSSAQ